MNYVTSNLQKDEQIKISAEFSKLGALPWIIFAFLFIVVGILNLVIYKAVGFLQVGILLCVLFCVLGWMPFFVALVDIGKQELAVTNKRVIGKRGILGMKTIDILLDKVESVSVEAGFIGRLAGYYRIRFSGSGTSVIVFTGVKNAEEIKNAISSLQQ